MNAGAPMAGSAVPRDGNMNYETLSWDSDFFGMSVARIVAPVLSGDELKKAISQLRQEGVKLVYWASTSRREATEINALSGLLVDTRTTFAMNFQRQSHAESDVADIVESYSPMDLP